MARTVINMNYNCNFDEASNRINSVLLQNGFKQQERNGESFWKKGTGLMTAMQFIKVDFSESAVTISAWVQSGIGNLGGSEMDLTGFVAAAPKKSLMKVIEKIKKCL